MLLLGKHFCKKKKKLKLIVVLISNSGKFTSVFNRLSAVVSLLVVSETVGSGCTGNHNIQWWVTPLWGLPGGGQRCWPVFEKGES